MADAPVVGVLTPFIGGAYYGELLAGVHAAAARAGSRVIAIQTLDAAAHMTVNQGTPTFTGPVSWDHLAGFIVLADAVTDPYLHRLEASGKPVVLLGHERAQASSPVVLTDNTSGIREAVAHLIAHGHRRIAFTGYLNASDVAERYRAYQETLLAHGITPDPALFLPATDNLESGIIWATPKALRDGPPAPAIVAGTDRNAIGVMRAMAAAGFQCPRDYALTGFDNTDVAPFLNPSLASVRQLFDAMGSAAIDLLLRMLAGEPPPAERHLVPTVFVPRGSCGCTDEATTLPTSVAAPGRSRLAARLDELLPPPSVRSLDAHSTLRQAVDTVADAIEEMAAGRPRHHDTVVAALLDLYCMRPQPESLRLIARAVQEFTRELPGDDLDTARRVDRYVQEIILVLARAHGRAQFTERWRLRSTISAHYELSMSLLYNRDADPRDLAWLAATPVAAGSVGLWDDAGELQLSPGWRRDPGPAIPAGPTTISAFPPAELVAAARPHEMVFVVPAKVNASDRGLLAVVDVVESRVEDGRELVNQCAALLTVALDLREQEDRLRQAALSDTLTGLPNRAALVDVLDRAVLADHGRFGVLFLDLDGFKDVNDTLGHAAGDQLLVHVAERIRRCLRAGDVAARFGGDEFVVFLADVAGGAQLDQIADRLREAITAPFHLADSTVVIGVSIGSTSGAHRRSADEILLEADAAMYRVKAGRKAGSAA